MILRYDQRMNTHPEPIDHNHPAIESLAREVLTADKVRDDTPGTLYLDGPTHEHEEAAGAILDAAPALARAVIDLTAKVARVEALADRLDVVANELEADGEDGYADAARTDAHSIRAALNGENHD